MNLLFNRDQKSSAFSLVPLRIGKGVMFHLHAELELDEEESALIKRYGFASTPIVRSEAFDDLKRAAKPAFMVSLVAALLIVMFGGIYAAMTFVPMVFVIMLAIYFNIMREQILVSDLLDGGRTFHCDSIVELIRKEAYLEGVCEYLRQVVESAKNWNDREVIPIQPLDKLAAKQMVLSGSRG